MQLQCLDTRHYDKRLRDQDPASSYDYCPIGMVVKSITQSKAKYNY